MGLPHGQGKSPVDEDGAAESPGRLGAGIDVLLSRRACQGHGDEPAHGMPDQSDRALRGEGVENGGDILCVGGHPERTGQGAGVGASAQVGADDADPGEGGDEAGEEQVIGGDAVDDAHGGHASGAAGHRLPHSHGQLPSGDVHAVPVVIV